MTRVLASGRRAACYLDRKAAQITARHEHIRVLCGVRVSR